MKKVTIIILSIYSTFCFGQSKKINQKPLPIIDMHLHSLHLTDMTEGGMPSKFPAPILDMGAWNQKENAKKYFNDISEQNAILSPKSDDDLRIKTFAILEKYNIYGVASGPTAVLDQWVNENPKRIIPGVGDEQNLTPELIKERNQTGKLKVLGELTMQYMGFTISDTIFEPILKVAEELDIPVGVHVGTGPPGVAYMGFNRYRAKFHSPLVVEEALILHPKLRMYLQHAGWPMIDDLLAVLYVHPQVYVDLGVICNAIPPKEFAFYVKRIVDAGFEKRIMFGSDQMIWPDAITKGIESINKLNFLSQQQKRDILFNNAARFLRLTPEQIKAMY